MGHPAALAVLVGREGPGSRPPGAMMAVAADDDWAGSLSGGCVEGVLLREIRDVLGGSRPHLTEIDIGGELMPWEPGPACRSTLQVLVCAAPGGAVADAITPAPNTPSPTACRTPSRSSGPGRTPGCANIRQGAVTRCWC